ncbi:MAG: SCP2 domain-containing protein [Gammaproteobacteria bacterium]|mgnify:CR=1 FL=1|tara:strand:+ start:741 stop:1358 length:618 start_codon:yes stop_codon:yes gene_type:complete
MNFVIKKLENYVNKILSKDEHTLHKLKKINNKVIVFKFLNTKIKLYVIPVINGLSISMTSKRKADVLINTTPSNFIKMLLSSRYNVSGTPVDMQVEGDISIAHDFEKIMRDLEIDIEDPMSNLLGDTLSYQIVRFTRRIGEVSLKSSEIMIKNLSEYLKFEVEMLPDELLIDEFLKEVDSIRNDVERVSQRIDNCSLLITNKEKK